jgi:hypothetical protein
MALINKKITMSHKLLCPVCNKGITGKIISCSNGDNICLECSKKDKMCNYCQSKTFYINYSLMNIMNDINLKIFNCCYDGCNELLTYNEAQEHLDNCSFNLITYNQLFSSELSTRKDYIFNTINDLARLKIKFDFNDINICFVINKEEYNEIIEYTYNKLNEYNLSNIKSNQNGNTNYTIFMNNDRDNKININIKELNMDNNNEFLYERIDACTPFLIVFYMIKYDIIMVTDDFHMDLDNYDISYCSLNEKNKNIPYVIKYIYEDKISLYKISKYKQNEQYILSLRNLIDSYDKFIINTGKINHISTNKFIIGLKQLEFSNYTLQDII